MVRLEQVYGLDDFEIGARRRLPSCVMTYVTAATETGASAQDNRTAFAGTGFRPSVLVDVSARSAAVTLFGDRFAAPFGIAPMGMASLVVRRADISMALAAGAAQVPMVVSGASLIRLEDIAAANPAVWFQAYLSGDETQTATLLERVAAAGIGTLVLTVDIATPANRETFRRGGFSSPLKPGLPLALDGLSHPRWLFGTALATLIREGMPHFENTAAGRGAPILSARAGAAVRNRDRLDWSVVARVRDRWRGRLVLKGVLREDDVARAAQTGVDGVILSNHGGRQLDGAVSPLRMLPACVGAAGNMPVMMDGGIRRGTDVLKAFALGAAFVFVGRPFLCAVAVAGQRGVAHAIELLRTEVETSMALVGVTGPAEMRPDHLYPI